MDTWQNKQTLKFHRNRRSRNPSCSALPEARPPLGSAPFHRRRQLTRGSQPLDHRWRKSQTDPRRGFHYTVHVVKRHPAPQTAGAYALCLLYVRSFIHVTVSNILRLTNKKQTTDFITRKTSWNSLVLLCPAFGIHLHI